MIPGQHGHTRFIPATNTGNTSSAVLSGATPTVHPRPRGEHQICTRYPRITFGSSPPMRGNDSVDDAEEVHLAVHPRRHEEHSKHSVCLTINYGSSPHTRGTPVQPRGVLFHFRFIPAHAGNTEYFIDTGIADPVHPRPRGEHSYDRSDCVFSTGSSPHTRGTRVLDARNGLDLLVHPHTHGEHLLDTMKSC